MKERGRLEAAPLSAIHTIPASSEVQRAHQTSHVPPHNVEAEESVLGALLLSARALVEVSEILNADDFFRENHSTIYRAALALVARDVPVDAITLADYLEQRGQLDGIGGTGRIAELAALVPSTSNVGHYARIVRRHALGRRALEIGYALWMGADPETVLPELQDLVRRAEAP